MALTTSNILELTNDKKKQIYNHNSSHNSGDLISILAEYRSSLLISVDPLWHQALARTNTGLSSVSPEEHTRSNVMNT